MTLKELRSLVRKGEGPELEFKRTTGELKEGLKALCGMLNAGVTGSVLFGVNDDGSIVGQNISSETLREVANLSRSIEPHVDVSPKRIRLKSKSEVLALAAQAHGHSPYTFDGRGYVRIGNTTQRMSRAEFDRRALKQLKDVSPWDEWIAPKWKIKDLDLKEVAEFVDAATHQRRLTGALGEKPEIVLRRLELVTKEGVTRGAVVVFGKEPGPGPHFGKLRVARFRGTTKDEFRDNRMYHGHAFELFRQAEKFLDEYVPVASEFIPGQMARKDIPKYPPVAYREALINAFVHRDYSIPGGAVSVAIYDDRLEISSTGTLPDGVILKKLKGFHESVLRNPGIADTFYLRGMIEEWGRGTNKILTEAKKLGCPEPEFEEIPGAFVVRLWPAFDSKEERLMGGMVGLTERQQKLLAFVRAAEGCRLKDIVAKFGKEGSKRTLQRDLNALRQQKLVAFSGRGRGARFLALPEKE